MRAGRSHPVTVMDGLVPTREVLLPGAGILDIAGGDFNGDGLLDLAFIDGLTLELRLNRDENGFETILQLSDVGFEGLADGDGDGDVHLLVGEINDPWSNDIM